jgi:hypothetical protein
MIRISAKLKPARAALTFAGAVIATLVSTGAFAGSAKAGVSRASTWAVQSAVRDARDQVQRRQWAQPRYHHR